jgi:5-methylcytosine-specific restriction endonuclease McrA
MIAPAVATYPCLKCGAPRSGGRCKSCRYTQKTAWRKANPEKAKAAVDRWAKENQDRISINKAAYYIANKSKLVAYQIEHRLENLDKIRLTKAVYYTANVDRMRVKNAKWRAVNSEAIRIYSQNRRARVRAAAGSLSIGITQKLFKLQKGKCACCGAPLGKKYHLDHITPLFKGGTNTDGNVQLLTQTCNLQKSARDPIDFMQSRGFLL